MQIALDTFCANRIFSTPSLCPSSSLAVSGQALGQLFPSPYPRQTLFILPLQCPLTCPCYSSPHPLPYLPYSSPCLWAKPLLHIITRFYSCTIWVWLVWPFSDQILRRTPWRFHSKAKLSRPKLLSASLLPAAITPPATAGGSPGRALVQPSLNTQRKNVKGGAITMRQMHITFGSPQPWRNFINWLNFINDLSPQVITR